MLKKVTPALGTTAQVESRTLPRMLAESNCAKRAGVPHSSKRTQIWAMRSFDREIWEDIGRSIRCGDGMALASPENGAGKWCWDELDPSTCAHQSKSIRSDFAVKRHKRPAMKGLPVINEAHLTSGVSQHSPKFIHAR